jgi:hypothetical protein
MHVQRAASGRPFFFGDSYVYLYIGAVLLPSGTGG